MSRLLRAAFYSFLTVACTVIMWGCGKSETSRALHHVPSDAKSVTIVNVKNLALQSGCNINAQGQIELTPEAVEMLDRSDMATQTVAGILCSNAPYINIEEVVWYVPENSSKPIVVFEIKDAGKFESSLARLSIASINVDKFTVYSFPECVVAVKGNFGWIGRTAAEIIVNENNIGENHFASFKPVKEFFENDSHDIEFVFNNADNTHAELEYILAFGTFRNSGMFFEFHFIDAEGNNFRFDNVHDVDRNLLQFIPTQTQILLALGRVDDWTEIFKTLETNLPMHSFGDYNMYYQLAKDYISSINGTTLLAGAPVAGAQAMKNFSLETWQVLFMTHFPQDNTNAIIDLAKGFLSSQKIPCHEVSPGVYQSRLYNDDVMFGCVDGYTFLSNYDILVAGNTDMATAYEGKKGVIELMIPFGSETMKAYNLPWGVDFTISLSTTNVMVTLRLPGSNGPLLKELIKYLSSPEAFAS